MAIYGVGSKWNEKELKETFFKEGRFILGWNESSAKDLYSFISSLKVGDILYIKSNQPGSRVLRVKGIGIVTKSLIDCIRSEEFANSTISDWETLFIKIAWIDRTEFHITIPDDEGKLTNIRAATIYEEYLPFVQQKILSKIIKA